MPKFVNHLEIQDMEHDTAGEISKGVAVLPGAADDSVKLPGGGDGGATTVFGITMQKAAQGKMVPVVRAGNVEALVNANSVNIVRGDKLKVVATTGRLVKADTAGDYYFAEANEAATEDGVYVSVRLCIPGAYIPDGT